MPPWWLILFSASVALGWGAWALRRTRAVLPLLYLSAAVLGLTCFEAYLDITLQSGRKEYRVEASRTKYLVDDDVLGYAPEKDKQIRIRKYHLDSLVYDATYTIGKNGLRIASPHQGHSAGCIIFFGDSFTFGDGVNDVEPYPYQVGKTLGPNYATYNFAFSGYGPHQMLAALQAGRIEKTIECRPTHFFFLFIPAHIRRVAGLGASYRRQPRFRMDANGRVVRDGFLFDPPNLFGMVTLPRSTIETFRTWQKLFGRERAERPADLALATAVLGEAIRTARKRYPDSEFHVIIYDDTAAAANDDAVEKAVAAAGGRSHRITAIVPDIRINPDNYRIPFDGHPNGRLYRRLTNYIVSLIGSSKRNQDNPAAGSPAD